MKQRLSPIHRPTVQVRIDDDAASLASSYLARMGDPSWTAYARSQAIQALLCRRRGATGLVLRRALYPRLFAEATSPIIGEDVTIRGAGNIHLGTKVLIESGVLLDVKTDARPGLVIGDQSALRWGSRLDTGFHGSVRLGARNIIAGELLGPGGITAGDCVLIARGATVVSGNHRWSDPDVPIIDQGIELAPVHLEDDVWIGTGAVVMPGITIGRGAVIAANSVVNEDVPACAVMAGTPARRVRWRTRADVALEVG
jgi:acetyltransferase-like isoleucine patch superfamily enzyme